MAGRHDCVSRFRSTLSACVYASLIVFASGFAQAGTLLVVNKADDTVSLLDSQTGAVLGTLPTGRGPHEVALSPNGRWALVSNYGSDRKPDWTLTLIDVDNGRVARTIDLAPHTRPHGVVWHPDGRRALVTTEGSDSLLIVDVASGEILMEMATQGSRSHMVALTPDGRRAFVANMKSGSVTGFDLEREQRIGVVVTAPGAEGIAVHPDGKQVWVANRDAGTLTVLSVDDLSVITTMWAERSPIRIAFTPDGNKAVVTNAVSGSVSVFDARKMQHEFDFSTRLGFAFRKGRFLGGALGLMPVPVDVLVAEDGQSIYVSNSFAGRIGRYRISDGERIEVLTAGDQPDGLALSIRSSAPDVAVP